MSALPPERQGCRAAAPRALVVGRSDPKPVLDVAFALQRAGVAPLVYLLQRAAEAITCDDGLAAIVLIDDPPPQGVGDLLARISFPGPPLPVLLLTDGAPSEAEDAARAAHRRRLGAPVTLLSLDAFRRARNLAPVLAMAGIGAEPPPASRAPEEPATAAEALRRIAAHDHDTA